MSITTQWILGIAAALAGSIALFAAGYYWFTMQRMETIRNAQSADYVIFKGAPNDGAFAPADADVLAAQRLIRTKMPTLDDYYQQYYGDISKENGHRMMHLSAFRKELETAFPDWKTEPVGVDDGGEGFIDAEVDIDAGTLIFAQFHGAA